MKKLLLLSVSLPSLVAADLALAQDGQEDDTITVIGSRVKGRTALDSAVPVDVIQVGELQATPSLNLKDALTAVSPSYSVDRSAVVLLLLSMPMDVRRYSWSATTTLAHELAHQGSSQTADGRLLGQGAAAAAAATRTRMRWGPRCEL